MGVTPSSVDIMLMVVAWWAGEPQIPGSLSSFLVSLVSSIGFLWKKGLPKLTLPVVHWHSVSLVPMRLDPVI